MAEIATGEGIERDADLPAPLNTKAKQEARAKRLASIHFSKKVRRVYAPALQGCFSRTRVVELSDGEKRVIQFRIEPLDMAYFRHAHSKLGSVVPTVELVEDSELKGLGIDVYAMSYLPGIPWWDIDDNNILQRSSTAASLGKILSRGFVDNSSAAVVDAFITPYLWRIRDSLTETSSLLRIPVDEAIQAAPLLKSLPLWISHHDLNEMNVLIDPGTYMISGIVDWELSRDLPFGMGMHRVIDTIVARNVRGEVVIPASGEAAEAAFWTSVMENLPTDAYKLVNENLEAVENAIRIGCLVFSCFPPKQPPTKVLTFLKTALTYRLPQLRGSDEPFS